MNAITSPASVPFFKRQYYSDGFYEQWLERVKHITQENQFIGGAWVEGLEQKLAVKSEVNHVKACANGTDALQIALRAVGVKNGDVVLVPDLTFWATFEAVGNVGAHPVTIDIDPDDLHVTAELIEEGIKKFKPKAVILVHLYGWAARDTLAIRSLCRHRGVHLVEDSAQAWGVKLGDESLFKGALISTVSFFPGKVLGGAGDGGAILTQDPSLFQACHAFANHGRKSKYEHDRVGWNSRLDPLQAAFIDLALDTVDSKIEKRRKVVQGYQRCIDHLEFKIKAPATQVFENGYISVALISPENRERWMKHLESHGIGYGIVYPKPVRLQTGASGWLKGSIDRGISKQICSSILNLPCHAELTDAEVAHVCSVVQGGPKT